MAYDVDRKIVRDKLKAWQAQFGEALAMDVFQDLDGPLPAEFGVDRRIVRDNIRHAQTVFGDMLLMDIFQGLDGPPPPPPGGRVPTFWVNLDNTTDLGKFGGYVRLRQFDFARFQWYGDYGADPVAQAKAARPGITCFVYDAPDIVWDWAPDYPEMNAHEDWFLHDAAGARIKGADVSSWLPDLRNPAYRAHCVARVVAQVNKYNYPGFMWDGPNADDTGAGPITLLQEIRAALGTKLIITNSTPSFDYGADDDRYLAIADGTILEHGGPADINPGVFAWHKKIFERNLRAKKYLALSVNPATYANRNWYYAWYLLFADGQYLLFDDQTLVYPSAILGQPTDAAAESPAGVWTRPFEHGQVKVDLNNGTAFVG